MPLIPANTASPIRVTREELLALQAFNLVWWNGKTGRFFVAGDTKAAEVLRFLKAFRA